MLSTPWIAPSKMFTLPTIIAVKIKEDHGLDFWEEDFFKDNNKMAKFMSIIDTEYPLLKSTNRKLI